MNKSWMVYYICPLHTFYFLLTFLVCFLYKQGHVTTNPCFAVSCLSSILP